MRHSDGGVDPSRWRERPAHLRPGGIGWTVRALPDPVEPDDLRLAQIKQRIVQNSDSRSAVSNTARASWPRAVAFALGFVCLGGITTAMAARIYIRRIARATVAAPGPGGGSLRNPARDKTRRWRVPGKDAAELELSVSHGAEIGVVAGQAEISGAQVRVPEATQTREASTGESTGIESPRPRLAAPPEHTISSPPLAPPSEPAGAGATRLVSPTSALTRPHAPPSRSWVVATRDPAASVVPSTSPSNATASYPAPTPAPARPSATEAPADRGEASLVASALRVLRTDRSALDALTKLDEYRRRFPHGVLLREAMLARVEALLTLGRNDAALDVLDSLFLGSTGPDRKLTLARARLRADKGRCSQALTDLDQLLVSPSDDDVAETALFGRARCHLRTGDVDRARADLREYLRRFPDGEHKAEAGISLRRLSGH